MQRVSDIKPFGVRMPDEMKAWLQTRASENRRSINSELLLIIENEQRRVQKEAAHADD